MSGKVFRQMCGTVLIMEAIVIGLAIPVAIMYEHLRHGVAGGIGGGLAVCALLLSGIVGRRGMGWTLWAGTALQALVIAAGTVVPAMYILGVIFAGLWITAIWLARRLQTLPAPGAPGVLAGSPQATSSQATSSQAASSQAASSQAASPQAASPQAASSQAASSQAASSQAASSQAASSQAASLQVSATRVSATQAPCAPHAPDTPSA